MWLAEDYVDAAFLVAVSFTTNWMQSKELD